MCMCVCVCACAQVCERVSVCVWGGGGRRGVLLRQCKVFVSCS